MKNTLSAFRFIIAFSFIANNSMATTYIGNIQSPNIHFDCQIDNRVEYNNLNETRRGAISFNVKSNEINTFSEIYDVNFKLTRLAGDGVDGIQVVQPESYHLDVIKGLSYPELPAIHKRYKQVQRTPNRIVFSDPFSSSNKFSFYLTSEMTNKEVCSVDSFFPPAQNYTAPLTLNFFSLPTADGLRSNENNQEYKFRVYCKVTTTCNW